MANDFIDHCCLLSLPRFSPFVILITIPVLTIFFRIRLTSSLIFCLTSSQKCWYFYVKAMHLYNVCSCYADMRCLSRGIYISPLSLLYSN
jgi:hypothetical protein